MTVVTSPSARGQGPAERTRHGQQALWRALARPSWLPELVLLVVGYVLFSVVQAHLGETHREAAANAQSLQTFERTFRLDWEQPLNHWLADHLFLTHVAGYFYGACLIVPPIVLGWVYCRAAEQYLHLRRVLITTTLLSLPVFWLYAVAPPRFAMHGIVDVIATRDILGGATSRDSGTAANLYAAMPSLHMAWASWCALAIWWCVRRSHRRVAHLAWAFPGVTALDVVATGNHYVVDVLAGVALMLVGLVVVMVWSLSTGRTPMPEGAPQPTASRTESAIITTPIRTSSTRQVDGLAASRDADRAP
ncbi:phosphatase PAP2 family protein [Luteipulveratus sp. YIM 133132]|uniref:phosphatase PAP2 family protein n=1 Tax=Luteipulveratus flavus TaxID=3031728 RepID=UPI0023B0F160|nr:phosphatase PAP2 family protein [Luteipulveratus sp. YIM 133132]MDE9366854.1 phosphatase PAP2 family protein [Luteipulveratus sp. YIM 133132]